MASQLSHVGVLGMHWGHRKSVTTSSHPDHAKARELQKKKLHEMSNDDIRTYAARIELEQRYRNLNPGKVKRGVKHVDNTLAIVGKVVAAAGTITAAAALGRKLMKLVPKGHGVMDYSI